MSQLIEVERYECQRCLKIFNRKDILKKHVEKKNKCKISYKCNTCERFFYDKSTLNKHLKSKSHEKIASANINNNITNTANISTGNHSIVGNNNTQINVMIRNFYSKSDTSHLKDEYFKGMFLTSMTPSLFIGNFFEKIHLNESKPENYNVYINNIQTKIVKVFEEDGWTELDNKFIYEIILDIINYLDEKCSEVCEKKCPEVCGEDKCRGVCKRDLNRLYSLTDKVEKCIQRKEYQNKSVRDTYNHVAIAMYNQKQIIKSSIKKSLGPYLKDIEKNGSIGKFLPIKIKDLGKETELKTLEAPKITEIESLKN